MKRVIAIGEKGLRIGQDHQSKPVLTNDEVDLILDLRDEDPKFWTYKRQAEKFGVCKSSIAHYIYGRRRACTPVRWKTVEV